MTWKWISFHSTSFKSQVASPPLGQQQCKRRCEGFSHDILGVSTNLTSESRVGMWNVYFWLKSRLGQMQCHSSVLPEERLNGWGRVTQILSTGVKYVMCYSMCKKTPVCSCAMWHWLHYLMFCIFMVVIHINQAVNPYSPTEPLAAMAAASRRTSTIPARTVAELLLLASKWPKSCWMTRWECWDWKEGEKDRQRRENK